MPWTTRFDQDQLARPGRRAPDLSRLEVCPSIAVVTPSCEIHPAVVLGLADLGERFRLVANEIEVVPPTAPLPKLPVAGGGVWRPAPDLGTSAEAWLTAGGPHHTVLSQAVGVEELQDLADMTATEPLVNRRRDHGPPVQQGDPLERGVPPAGPRF